MPKLEEVYGISTAIPRFTYVDRFGLDDKFEHFLAADRHIVIYGASKQGKTILRRKHLSEAESIVVSCHPNDTVDTLRRTILSEIGGSVETSLKRKKSSSQSLDVQGEAQLSFPIIGGGRAGAKAISSGQRGFEVEERSLVDETTSAFLVSRIRSSRRRLVFEDFHYLPESERKNLCYLLKEFWDKRIFVLVIGIWAEQNLLAYYNPDLAGRVEEIDVRWTDEELSEVLEKGEVALNLRFSPFIRQQVVKDANKNVGLLQRILEAICLEAGIRETRSSTAFVGDQRLLDQCRKAVCRNVYGRYYSFANVFGRGFKNPEKTKLQLYRQLVRVCIEASDDEITNGIPREEILTRIKKYKPDAELQLLSRSLARINRLQSERKITPLILSYDDITKQVQIVDKELLFYRKYTDKPWPWEHGYDDSDEDADDGVEW